MKDNRTRPQVLLQILDRVDEKEHYHQDIELFYVLSGNLTVYQASMEPLHLKAEDVLVINSNVQHRLAGDDKILLIKITITYNLMEPLLDDFIINFACDSSRGYNPWMAGLRHEIRELLRISLDSHSSNPNQDGEGRANFRYIAQSYTLMGYLCSHFLLTGKGTNEKDTKDSDKYQIRMEKINAYIMNNYRNPISIHDLSEQLYLSEGYLSRFFKKNFGASFSEYLTKVRLRHAVDDLLYTDNPITHISYDNGFANVTKFNRAFRKEYGETPSAVRSRSNVRPEEETGVDSVEAIRKAGDLLAKEPISQDGQEMETISFSAGRGRHYRQPWNQIINMGAAADLLKSGVQDHILLLKKQLHFTYVRFWSPFSPEMMIHPDDPGHHYNFTMLYSVLDFLTANNILPFIDLASKPRRITRNTSTTLRYDAGESARDLENWTALLEFFLRKCVSRYGKENIARWGFELWMDESAYNEDGIARYVKKYRASADLVHELAGSALGGPGLRSYDHPCTEELMSDLKESGFDPDFWTLYLYPYVYTEDGSSRRAEDPAYTAHALKRISSFISKNYPGREIWLTEFGTSISDRNFLNDSCYRAAVQARAYMQILGQVPAAGCYQGSDLVIEYYDSESMLFGGSGILTKNGIMKPVGSCIRFFNHLYPLQAGHGENYVATTDEQGNIALIVENAAAPGGLYFDTEEDKIDKRNLPQYFIRADQLHITCHVDEVKEGRYHVELYRVNAHEGSILDLWKEMDYENDLSVFDIDYLEHVCSPKLTMWNVTSHDGTITLNLELEPDETAFLRIVRRTSESE
ncbi:MAG: helix-turn-helix domain-containing protein [Lachnospiraceae bacterium]|nr:helix-turn-helix domain-containing protein [Lachnospiraceae bacterium]